MHNFYITNPKTAAVAHRLMNNSTVKRLWKSFCLEDGEIEINPCEEFIFKIGDPGIAELKAESEYVLSVSENGIFIKARDYSGLVHGFYALLMKINYNNDRFEIHITKEYGDFLIKNRMIHICVFPETSCQGLFNQIHKKATKKCQKQILAPDTFADGLFAPA